MGFLRIPTQPMPNWADFGRYGEGGSYGYYIEAGGLTSDGSTIQHNLLMHQELLPYSGDVSLLSRIRLKSTLDVGNPSFEGLAFRHRGYQLDGSYPNHTKKQVWHSNPLSLGADAWFSQQSDEFITWSSVAQVPSELGIDLVTYEVDVRALSGAVWIDALECRNTYNKKYTVPNTGAQAYINTGLLEEEQTVYLPDPATYWNYVKYLHTQSVNIRKGQTMTFSTQTTGVAGVRDPDSSFAIASTFGVMAKMRIRNSTVEELYTLGTDPVIYTIGNVEETRAPVALNDYDRMQILVFVRAQTPIQTPYRYINHNGVAVTLQVGDE